MSNLPDGCTEEDIDHSYTGDPRTLKEVRAEIKFDIASEQLESLLDDPYELRHFIVNSPNIKTEILNELESRVTDEEIESELKENWEWVDYSKRNGGSGYVPK